MIWDEGCGDVQENGAELRPGAGTQRRLCPAKSFDFLPKILEVEHGTEAGKCHGRFQLQQSPPQLCEEWIKKE